MTDATSNERNNMDSETTFEVGDRVRVVMAIPEHRDWVDPMDTWVDGEFPVTRVATDGDPMLKGIDSRGECQSWYFPVASLQLIERDGKRVGEEADKDVNTSQQVCQGLSRRERIATAAMQAIIHVEEAQGWSDEDSTTLLPNEVADHAIGYADALITALDAGEGE